MFLSAVSIGGCNMYLVFGRLLIDCVPCRGTLSRNLVVDPCRGTLSRILVVDPCRGTGLAINLVPGRVLSRI